MKRATTYRPVLWAFVLASLTFFAYTCVFAFRKPFSIATFGGLELWGISYQTILIISQVIGYMLSKFIGIRFISSLKRDRRWKIAIWLIGSAWLSMLFFALLPPVWGILCFLVNGFMMGFMWGVVFSYAEGRRSTDFIGSALAVSFIFAGGFTRSVAKWLMTNWGVPEHWMPFMTGAVFALPLVLFFYLLENVPPPDPKDIDERQQRISMTADDRRMIVNRFFKGLFVLGGIYTLLTVMRDIRDNYMGNMWAELGYAGQPAIFTRSETMITLVLLVMMGSIVLIRKNIRAFRLIHGMIAAGFLLAGISSWLFFIGWLDGAIWMQAAGLGLYMAYIPFNSIFFERMIATFRLKGNVGFLIYITDAFGYLGSVLVMLFKESMQLSITWSQYYARAVMVLALIGFFGTLYALYYFSSKHKRESDQVAVAASGRPAK
jgi:MFS family permease